MLIILLNELLSGEHHIEDLTFLDKEDRSENIHDKGIIYDLYCRTSTGEYIIVEMQNRWHSHFLDRTLYYVCRAVSRQMHRLQSRDKGGIADIQLIRRYAFHLQRLTAYCVLKMYVHFAQKMSRINANVVQ
nr:MAG: PD-(D/E)XK nuclease family transposase [Bacteriophage sp.]